MHEKSGILGAVLMLWPVGCDQPSERLEGEAEIQESGPRNAEQSAARSVPNDEERYQDGPFDENPRAESTELVLAASRTLDTMTKNASVRAILRDAKGVLIVPSYGRGAAVVGARGGEGVLLARKGEKWSGPYFYDVGGLSVGPQAGAEAGEVAVILTSEEALDTFKSEDTASLNAGAQLNLVHSQSTTEASPGDTHDAVFWSNLEGVFVGASLGLSDIDWDDDENAAYYGKRLAAREALRGKDSNPDSLLEQKLTKL